MLDDAPVIGSGGVRETPTQLVERDDLDVLGQAVGFVLPVVGTVARADAPAVHDDQRCTRTGGQIPGSGSVYIDVRGTAHGCSDSPRPRDRSSRSPVHTIPVIAEDVAPVNGARYHILRVGEVVARRQVS